MDAAPQSDPASASPEGGPSGPANPGRHGSPPRAFAQGTGVAMQVVGFTLFLSTCCLCALSGNFDHVPSKSDILAQPLEPHMTETGVRAHWQRLRSEPGRAGVMLIHFFATAGGLGMMVFGLGLQSDKPKAAHGAVAVAALMLMVLLVSGWLLWSGEGAWFARAWHALLMAVTMLVLLFAVGALRQVRADPPPPGLEILPADFEIPKSRHF